MQSSPNTSSRNEKKGAIATLRPAVRDVMLLSAIWLGAVVVVNPLGNFPLNDDWAYALSVRGILGHGTYDRIQDNCTTLISQAYWGALFCLPAGFSFVAMRLSTLCLALVGILGMYFLLKRLGATRGVACLGALVLGFNPIYFALSFTFMTDVPFTALVVVSLLLMFAALEKDTNLRLIGSALLAGICVLCRQLGLFLPLAFAACFVVRYGLTWRSLVRGAIPLAVGLGAFLGFRWWLAATGSLGNLDHFTHRALTGVTSAGAAEMLLTRSAAVGLCWGLLLFPFTLLLPVPNRTWPRSALIVGVAVPLLFALFVAFRWLRHGYLMPVLPNVLAPWGIGPVTLRDIYILHLPHMRPLPAPFWLAVTILSILGGGILLACLLLSALRLPLGTRSLRWEHTPVVVLFVLVGCLAYCKPICLVPLFDRYVIGVLPLLLCLMALSASRLSPCVQRRRLAIAACVLAPYMLFSVAGTRDYLTWNKLRWEVLRTLTQDQSIPPTQIDGGYEFNGWYGYDAAYRPPPAKSWWWIHDDQYLVSVGPVEGYETAREVQYSRWLPPREARVLLLRRLPAAERPKGSIDKGRNGKG